MMGSGFNFFTNAIDKSLITTGAWVDVDCSANIPAGATGVILKIVNTSSTARSIRIRKNGSAESIAQEIGANQTVYAFCAVDENRIFEGYISSDVVDFYLIGYTDDAVVFFDPTLVKTPATAGSWQDIDLSGDVPADAVGVIMMLRITSSYTSCYVGVRKNGSTDEFPYGKLTSGSVYNHVYQLCGVDSNRLIEGKVDSTSTAQIRLVAYVKSPIVFFTNGVDKSLADIGAWIDVDITSETTVDTDGAILFVKNTSPDTTYLGDVRKNGSTDNHYGNTKLSFAASNEGNCRGCAIGVDAEQIFEGQIENVAVDFYLIGYCKPAEEGPVLKEVTDSIGLLDAVLRDKILTVSDSVSLADSCLRDKIFEILDSVGLSDSILRDKTFQILDGISLSELITVIKEGILKEVLDSIGLTDAILANKTLIVVDALGLTEQTIADKQLLIVDQVQLSENVYVNKILVVSDQLSLVETVEVGVGGAAKTKLFLVMGNLAIQLSG